MYQIPEHLDVDMNISSPNGKGILRVFEGQNLPFSARRIFTIREGKGATRGRHAHLKCNQLLICLFGKIEVSIDDGCSTKRYMLYEDTSPIIIPAGYWAEQRYLSENNVLMVICDQPYDECDYIRDYNDYLKWKGASQ